MIRHAGLIARLGPDGLWDGVLIEGPSGAGKSDLALRALEAGWRLVADDRVLLWRSGAGLFGRAPERLAGLMEVRGLGVLPAPFRRLAQVRLLARCMQDVQVERLPETASETILGVALPMITLAAREASAPAKLSQALTCLGLRS